MTTQTEMRELDEWLIKHGVCPAYNPAGFRSNPTADSAAAFGVLKECAEKVQPISVHVWQADGGQWKVGISTSELAPTLELAICLFARKLFEK